MTRDIDARTRSGAVRVRATEGEIGEDVLARARVKVEAIVRRPGLPAASGEVRIWRASVHHDERPWSAVAEISLGSSFVVAHAQEATSAEVVDRLQDRLRRQVERVVRARSAARRPVAPPWRRSEGERGAGHGGEEGSDST